MDTNDLVGLLETLIQLPRETEWVEFKVNNGNPEDVGEYISALANSAALHRKELAYIVWGVENETHEVVGTSFNPKAARHGNEELESWLARLLSPRVDFRIYQFEHQSRSVSVIEIVPCLHTPVRFRDTSWIRVGSYKKKLRDFPEKERALWAQLSGIPFEKMLALDDVDDEGVLRKID
jgi:predicted HTH transcriptional regulator